MGIYINMEMPKNCYVCSFCRHFDEPNQGFFCLILEEKLDYGNSSLCTKDNCPLVPVPPHGNLIDRDALEQDAQKRLLICNKYDDQFQKPYEVMRAIALAPTIIPADESNMDSFIRIFEEDDEEDGMDSFIRILKD